MNCLRSVCLDLRIGVRVADRGVKGGEGGGGQPVILVGSTVLNAPGIEGHFPVGILHPLRATKRAPRHGRTPTQVGGLAFQAAIPSFVLQTLIFRVFTFGTLAGPLSGVY
jgi:hypothetical protein